MSITGTPTLTLRHLTPDTNLTLMTLTTYAGKHIVILGLARQGTALARFFVRAGARVTISDVASADQLVRTADRAGRHDSALGSRQSSLRTC